MQTAHKIIASEPVATPPECAIPSSIAAIGREAWNACYPNELEDYDYLLAMEEAGIPGFAWRYVTVAQHGRVQACCPAFLTDYSVATTLEGFPKRLVQAVQRRFPRFLVLKLACLGSPQTECGYAGFHPSVPETRKPELLRQMLTHFEREMTQAGFRLLGVKDVPEWQKPLWDQVALPMDFRPLPGMATSYLDIDFASTEDYLNRLSGETRKDMRRKLKALPQLRIERRTRIDDVLPQVHTLYLDTKNRSDFEFEELPAAYFSGILSHMEGRAHCTLYYAGDELLAANLMLENEHTLLDKFFCMDGKLGRLHHLYFISWFTNVQYCIERGIKRYQSGQAGDASKRRLGSQSIPNWLLFKHDNRTINGLLRLISPLLAMEEKMIFPRWITIVLWVCMLTLNTASQLAMKLAADGLQTQAFGFAWLQMAMLSPYIWLALGCEGINFALWLAILKRHTLSMAFSLSSVTYALILITSWALLHEAVRPLQAAGTLLILSGILLMGQRAPAKKAEEM